MTLNVKESYQEKPTRTFEITLICNDIIFKFYIFPVESELPYRQYSSTTKVEFR